MEAAIVIDNGSYMCKAGIAGDDTPRARFLNFIGTPLFKNQIVGMNSKDRYYGDHAVSISNIVNLNSPFDRDVIVDWDGMTNLIEHTFYNQLRTRPWHQPCLMSEPFHVPRTQRQNLTQIMFQKFTVPSFYLQKTPKLSIYSFGKTTGLIVDVGHNLTQLAPLYQGFVIPYSVEVNQFGGIDLNQYLIKLLRQVKLKLHSSEIDRMNLIKQKHCYVANNYQQQLKKPLSSLNSQYQLPDGTKMIFDELRFKCPELLFQPQIIGRRVLGIHDSVYNNIKKCEKNLHPELYNNICICGGSTMFPGFYQRLNRQLVAKVPQTIKVRIPTVPERKFMTWIGGSILASLSTFQTKWITKLQFEEYGPSIINKKCAG